MVLVIIGHKAEPAIIVDNVASGTPPGMGGTVAGITIPVLSVTLATGNTLKTAASFDFEAKSQSSIRVGVTDSLGFTREQSFVIQVTVFVQQKMDRPMDTRMPTQQRIPGNHQ